MTNTVVETIRPVASGPRMVIIRHGEARKRDRPVFGNDISLSLPRAFHEKSLVIARIAVSANDKTPTALSDFSAI